MKETPTNNGITKVKVKKIEGKKIKKLISESFPEASELYTWSTTTPFYHHDNGDKNVMIIVDDPEVIEERRDRLHDALHHLYMGEYAKVFKTTEYCIFTTARGSDVAKIKKAGYKYFFNINLSKTDDEGIIYLPIFKIPEGNKVDRGTIISVGKLKLKKGDDEYSKYSYVNGWDIQTAGFTFNETIAMIINDISAVQNKPDIYYGNYPVNYETFGISNESNCGPFKQLGYSFTFEDLYKNAITQEMYNKNLHAD